MIGLRLQSSLVFLGVLFFGQMNPASANAKTVVHDPSGTLLKARTFLGKTEFTQAFRCGESAKLKVYVIACTDYQSSPSSTQQSCQTVSDPAGLKVKRSVVSCSPDQVSLLVDATGDMTTITRASFDEANNNVAELFMSNLVEFTGFSTAELTLSNAAPAKFILARDSRSQRTVDALTITGVFGEPKMMGLPFIITVIKDALGVAQLVRFRLGNNTWFLVDDFGVEVTEKK